MKSICFSTDLFYKKTNPLISPVKINMSVFNSCLVLFCELEEMLDMCVRLFSASSIFHIICAFVHVHLGQGLNINSQPL